MSGGVICKCDECKEPLTRTGNRPARLWRVIARMCNYSAFNGYRYSRSDYSSICCLHCGAHWRTKANYVGMLQDRTEAEINIGPGYAGYGEAMETLGRSPWTR